MIGKRDDIVRLKWFGPSKSTGMRVKLKPGCWILSRRAIPRIPCKETKDKTINNKQCWKTGGKQNDELTLIYFLPLFSFVAIAYTWTKSLIFGIMSVWSLISWDNLSTTGSRITHSVHSHPTIFKCLPSNSWPVSPVRWSLIYPSPLFWKAFFYEIRTWQLTKIPFQWQLSSSSSAIDSYGSQTGKHLARQWQFQECFLQGKRRLSWQTDARTRRAYTVLGLHYYFLRRGLLNHLCNFLCTTRRRRLKDLTRRKRPCWIPKSDWLISVVPRFRMSIIQPLSVLDTIEHPRSF